VGLLYVRLELRIRVTPKRGDVAIVRDCFSNALDALGHPATLKIPVPVREVQDRRMSPSELAVRSRESPPSFE